VRTRLRSDPHFWPVIVLLASIAVLALCDRTGRFLSMTTTFSTLQIFSNVGLVALGLGLSMMIRNFDISVAGVYSLAGCIAVMTGSVHPWLGIVLAVGAGLTVGLLQGLIVVGFRLGSVGVTLGGLLICVGIAHVLTENRAVPFDNLDVSLALNAPIAAIFSIRSIVTLGIFALAAFIIAFTRLGRDLIATGSDRQAAAIAGVGVNRLTIAALGFSGFCSALSGALLSYSLASASPAGLSEVIVPAAAAAILGGVSLGGGSGRPFGIVAGALTLAVMQSGLNAIGGQPYLNDVAMGAILFTVAILDGHHFARHTGFFQIR
jgi:ribose/xylose/arabinose/galactoside ABC-type transport system permease subunit